MKEINKYNFIKAIEDKNIKNIIYNFFVEQYIYCADISDKNIKEIQEIYNKQMGDVVKGRLVKKIIIGKIKISKYSLPENIRSYRYMQEELNKEEKELFTEELEFNLPVIKIEYDIIKDLLN